MIQVLNLGILDACYFLSFLQNRFILVSVINMLIIGMDLLMWDQFEMVVYSIIVV